MLETLKVAQHKVAQTQSLSDNLELNHQKKSERIEEMNQVIQRERRNQLDDVVVFEDKLSKLTAKFLEAKNFYEQDNLRGEMSCTSSEIKQNESEIMQTEREADEMDLELHNLRLDNRGVSLNPYHKVQLS